MSTPFAFTNEQRSEFRHFLENMNSESNSSWPSQSNWLTYPGMPSYELNQFEQPNGKLFTIIRFEDAVNVKGTVCKRFKCGGDYTFQPICPKF